MNEKALKELTRNCLKEYHEEDKKILIDVSITKISCSIYLLYNLIFFGNKIYIFKETLKLLIKISAEGSISKASEIKTKNAKYILDSIQRDNETSYNNYKIIEMKQYGETKYEAIQQFLMQNPDAIFYLANYELYEKLKENGLSKQMCFLNKGLVETKPFGNREFKFETIGAIKIENKKMLISQKENSTTTIKVYNSKGIEKQGDIQEVKPRDLILIKSIKEDGNCSFLLYEVVSRHSRNQSIRIIWTNLKKGQKTNKYMDRLPYKYRKMILDNIN